MIRKIMAFLILRTRSGTGDAAHDGQYAAKAVNAMLKELKQPSESAKGVGDLIKSHLREFAKTNGLKMPEADLDTSE